EHTGGNFIQSTDLALEWLTTFQYDGVNKLTISFIETYGAQHLILITKTRVKPDLGNPSQALDYHFGQPKALRSDKYNNQTINHRKTESDAGYDVKCPKAKDNKLINLFDEICAKLDAPHQRKGELLSLRPYSIGIMNDE
ncbi:11353_t:CDS:2, partial [Racocetra persica]